MDLIPPLVTDFQWFAPILLESGAIRALPDCTVPPLSLNGICDASKSPYERAAALVSEMTIEQKYNNTMFYLSSEDNLGLPQFTLWNEGLHGVATSLGVNYSQQGDYSYATSFPMPILTSAAFDDDLVHSVAEVISTELRAFSNAGHAGFDIWAPNVNPFRDPRWGRGPETPGEDVFRISQYATAYISGIQGPADSPFKKAVATCKHVAGYDVEDTPNNITRYSFDAKISIQDLADYYLRPFETCTRDAGVGSLMCSYNSVNGIPQCADGWVQQDLIRDHWKWNKTTEYITSDCFAIDVIQAAAGHHWTKTGEETLSKALKAGTDSECGFVYRTFWPTAMEQDPGLESYMDLSLKRVYASFVGLGLFDAPESQPYRQITFDAVNTPETQKLARKAATSGITLLKNLKETLPFQVQSGKELSVALVGDWANATVQLTGGYAGPAPYYISPLDALSNETGVKVSPVLTLDHQDVLDAAKANDVVIYIGGIDQSIEAEQMDRRTIAWNETQVDLIGSIAQLNKTFILVQTGGGQLDDSAWLNSNGVSAIVWAGYPGQEGGAAIADVLFGRVAPAGRLPVTQYPASYTAFPQTVMGLRPDPATGNLGQTYKWYTGKPVLPFGHGLHYTSFGVSVQSFGTFDIPSVVKECGDLGYGYLDQCPLGSLNVKVTNTGKVKSDYVALAFASGSYGPAPHPNKSLIGYQRLFDIEPGQDKTAQVQVKLAQLARFDNDGNRILYPGTYRVAIDTDPEKASFEFTLTGEQAILESWPKYDRLAPQ
ncbi:glycoside hydrolase family 3 protein [Annulohypoxylon maeteangense]|uniref:glycoside hydrolase family 3 protein n=1 Tax=Annulohypoxylon maeteangense TaxID=1927788 RepID=UPI00200728C9|nr:glycoside hydrolase family 3 protein [Annulohypoxylon maeteangense]KAI0885148.1 glycoside hydrolase family 3 protein [Annulohypoxylon maeteangense]